MEVYNNIIHSDSQDRDLDKVIVINVKLLSELPMVS